LRSLLIDYYPNPRTWFLFPGRHGKGHIHPDSAARILKSACEKLDLEGISTHSFRRTALTQMSNAGIPLRVIQQISRHRSLGVLQEYLEVTPDMKSANWQTDTIGLCFMLSTQCSSST